MNTATAIVPEGPTRVGRPYPRNHKTGLDRKTGCPTLAEG
jgi:hypothetical protein